MNLVKGGRELPLELVSRTSPLPHQQEGEQQQLWRDSGRVFSGPTYNTQWLPSAQGFTNTPHHCCAWEGGG